MGTTALIVYKNTEGLCNCVSVNWDGYIENGVGETLYNNWQDGNEVKKLCSMNKEVRSLESTMKGTEFYADEPLSRKRAKKLKNLTIDEVKNKSGNYSYTYVWEEDNPGWKVLLDGSLEWELEWVGEILNY